MLKRETDLTKRKSEDKISKFSQEKHVDNTFMDSIDTNYTSNSVKKSCSSINQPGENAIIYESFSIIDSANLLDQGDDDSCTQINVNNEENIDHSEITDSKYVKSKYGKEEKKTMEMMIKEITSDESKESKNDNLAGVINSSNQNLLEDINLPEENKKSKDDSKNQLPKKRQKSSSELSNPGLFRCKKKLRATLKKCDKKFKNYTPKLLREFFWLIDCLREGKCIKDYINFSHEFSKYSEKERNRIFEKERPKSLESYKREKKSASNKSLSPSESYIEYLFKDQIMAELFVAYVRDSFGDILTMGYKEEFNDIDNGIIRTYSILYKIKCCINNMHKNECLELWNELIYKTVKFYTQPARQIKERQ